MNDISEKEGQKIWNRLFIQVFIINFCVQLCIYMMNTLSATYVDYLGASASVVGMVSGLFALTALLFKFVSAPAIDAFNRKYILMFAIAVLGISFLGYALSQTVEAVITARLLTGVGMAFSATCCLAVASETLPTERMSSGIGYFAVGNAVGQAIAPALGLKLAQVFGYKVTFILLTVTMVISFFMTLRMKLTCRKRGKFRISVGSIVAKEALLPASLLFLLQFSFISINSFLVLFAGTKGIGSEIGYFFTVYAVSMLFTRPLIGNFADRFGPVKVLIPSMLCLIASLVIISFSNTLPAFLFAGFTAAFGFGGCCPALQAICMRAAGKERSGAASSTCYIGTDLGNLLGAAAAGMIGERLGYTAMWRVMAIPVLAAILICLIGKEKLNRPEENR